MLQRSGNDDGVRADLLCHRIYISAPKRYIFFLLAIGVIAAVFTYARMADIYRKEGCSFCPRDNR
jgi:hypothetical protein